MNTAASALQELENAADQALQLALKTGLPPAIAAARATLTAVHAQQDALHFAQNVILSEARMIAQQQPVNVRRSTEFQQTEMTFEKLPTPAGLAVVASPAKSRSPRYEPVENFETAQALALAWRAPIFNLVPLPLAGPLEIHGGVRGRCAASMRKEHGQWQAKLTRVNL